MSPPLLTILRLTLASIWILFGVAFKIANLVPRHRQIVARFVGPTYAPPLTRLIGVGELLIGLWILSAIAPFLCAATQTVLIVTMNALELRRARDLLLAPRTMLAANALLVTAAWLVATQGRL